MLHGYHYHRLQICCDINIVVLQSPQTSPETSHTPWLSPPHAAPAPPWASPARAAANPLWAPGNQAPNLPGMDFQHKLWANLGISL